MLHQRLAGEQIGVDSRKRAPICPAAKTIGYFFYISLCMIVVAVTYNCYAAV